MATISKRTSKKGEVSYLIRVSLGYNKSGQQIVKSMTYKPESGMKPKAVEKELNRQAVLFEEQAKQDHAKQLQREAEKQEHRGREGRQPEQREDSGAGQGHPGPVDRRVHQQVVRRRSVASPIANRYNHARCPQG